PHGLQPALAAGLPPWVHAGARNAGASYRVRECLCVWRAPVLDPDAGFQAGRRAGRLPDRLGDIRLFGADHGFFSGLRAPRLSPHHGAYGVALVAADNLRRRLPQRLSGNPSVSVFVPDSAHHIQPTGRILSFIDLEHSWAPCAGEPAVRAWA